MKSYDLLAHYYDQLTVDSNSVQRWIEFTRRHAAGSCVLELCCGSGAMTEILAESGYRITAIDQSEAMLNVARTKNIVGVDFLLMDMKQLALNQIFDCVICYNDSLNYLTSAKDLELVFRQVHDHLPQGGKFLFDVHCTNRLAEFEDAYIEEGFIDDVGYQWCIQSEDEFLYQTWTFYFGSKNRTERHIQRIYDKETIKRLLSEAGFEASIYTDFDLTEETVGEKWFFAATRR